MSDDFEDPPLEFPNSDTEENCQDSIADTEPVTSSQKPYRWSPECRQLLLDHRIDPDNYDNDEKLEEEEEEEGDKQGNKAQEALKFRLPPLKIRSKSGSGQLQAECGKKRKKGKCDIDKNNTSEDEDEEARRTRTKKRKAERKARREAKAASAARQQTGDTESPPSLAFVLGRATNCLTSMPLCGSGQAFRLWPKCESLLPARQRRLLFSAARVSFTSFM